MDTRSPPGQGEVTRREQIILLLGSLNDFSYAPKASRIKGAQRSASVSEWRPCVRCGGRMEKVAGEWVLVAGEGSVTDRYGKLVACPDGCDDGRVRVDSYTGDKLAAQGESVYGTPFGMSFGEHLGKLIEQDTRHVDCPDCQGLDNVPTGVIRGVACRRCEGSGRAAVPGSWLSEPGSVSDDDEGFSAMVTRRDGTGSYHELEAVLVTLVKRLAGRLVAEAARLCALGNLNAETPHWFEVLVAWVDTQMPDVIVVPHAAKQALKEAKNHKTKAKGRAAGPALKQRDKEIRAHWKDGRGAQWIAGEYGLHVSVVYEVVHGKSAAA